MVCVRTLHFKDIFGRPQYDFWTLACSFGFGSIDGYQYRGYYSVHALPRHELAKIALFAWLNLVSRL